MIRRDGLAAFSLAISVMPIASPAHAETVAKPESADYSLITTKAKALSLVRSGVLVRILFFPVELGGEDVPANRGFVPPAAATARKHVVADLIDKVRLGTLDQMTVTPDYKGKSIVPTQILFHASSTKGGKRWAARVAVW